MKYRVENLRCEYLTNPTAIDALSPRLSWEGNCPREGAAQSAYRILAADSAEALKASEGNLWDSGRVESSRSLHVSYGGKPLGSFAQVFWKVMVWDERGRAGAWSKVATWTMGILDPKEWKGAWIGNYLGNCKASPLLRREFRTRKKQIRRALIHASALGLYHLTLNGKEVTDDVLAPGWTEFDKRRHYRGYDVTRLLRPNAAHCLGAELGDGWYRSKLGWSGNCTYGERLAFLGQLRIEYADGSVEVIPSDASWSSTFGPTVQSGIYEGETVDAQIEPKGWNRPGFSGEGWSPAVEIAPATELAGSPMIDPGEGPEWGGPGCKKAAVLEAYPAEPVRRTEELRPVRHWSVAPGKVIYDFGQNFAGWVRLHVPGKAGTVVRMRFGEMVNHDNTLYVENLRGALASDTYVMRGARREVWEPKFTFHGFRYVEVTGCPVPPSLDNVTGVVVGSDTPRAGHFECSSPLVNQIYSNAVWTQRANFLEVPTDCPQRDERLGWTGDAQVFIRTAISNMDTAAFFSKWMKDLIDAQDPEGAFPNVAPNVLKGMGNFPPGDAAWGDAGVVCPWTLYQCYEDRALLARMYPHMKAWVDYLKKTSRKGLRGPELTHTFGDWLSIDAPTPNEVVQTAHFAHAADITRKAAEVLGETADAKRLGKLFEDIRAAFNKAFVKKDGTIHGHTQTAYLMALKFGLLSEKRAAQAAKHLVDDIRKRKFHSSTGFVGTALIMSVLRDTGHLDLAYRLLENTTFPSWGYSVVNGATTIWERWNGWTQENGPGDVNMNSYSHYAYGAVVEWMFDTIAGIDHGECGFQRFRLRPRPGGSLKHAAASYHGPYGRIESAWRKRGKGFLYEATVPANTEALLSLPVKAGATITVNGRPVTIECDEEEIRLPAGTYRITW